MLLGGNSDEDDESVGGDSEEDTFFAGKGKGGKGGKAGKVEKASKGSDAADKGFDDDFFMDDGEGEENGEEEKPIKETKTKKSKGKSDTDMTFTYVPDVKKVSKEDKDIPIDETPFEAMQRRLTEKRKARKAAKKLLKGGKGEKGREGGDDDEDEEEEEIATKKSGKKGKAAEKEREEATKAELELLVSDEDEGYDMRALHKQEMDEKKGPKGKRKRYQYNYITSDTIMSYLFNCFLFTLPLYCCARPRLYCPSLCVIMMMIMLDHPVSYICLYGPPGCAPQPQAAKSPIRAIFLQPHCLSLLLVVIHSSKNLILTVRILFLTIASTVGAKNRKTLRTPR